MDLARSETDAVKQADEAEEEITTVAVVVIVRKAVTVNTKRTTKSRNGFCTRVEI